MWVFAPVHFPSYLHLYLSSVSSSFFSSWQIVSPLLPCHVFRFHLGHVLSFWVWLTFFKWWALESSIFLQMIQFHSSLWLSDTPLYLTPSSVHGHLGWSHALAVVNCVSCLKLCSYPYRMPQCSSVASGLYQGVVQIDRWLTGQVWGFQCIISRLQGRVAWWTGEEAGR